MTEGALERLRADMTPTPDFPSIDVAAWLGAYPFRGIPGSAVDDLKQKMRALTIERAIVAPFEGIFWENGLEAYERLADQCAGDDQLEVWPVVRPSRIHGLAKLLDRYRPRGLRLTPNYHACRLSDSAVKDVMAIARDRGMVVQVFQRIADERWHYLLHTPPVEQFDLDYLTSCYAEQIILVSGMNAIAPLASRLRQIPGLYADLSRIRGPQFAIEQMVKSLPVEKLVFGSLFPIQIIEATLWQITTANIDAAQKRQLLVENASRMFSEAASSVAGYVK